MSSQPAHQPPPLPTARLNDAERIACLRLIRTPSVGPVTFRELINVYGGAHAALDALPELSARSGRRALSIPPASRAEAELAAAEKAGARALFTIEPGYPMRLATLNARPPCLYVKGNAELLSTPSVALVGSRKCSANGIAITRQLAAGVGAAGYVTVSGLARGIDAAAHEASLATGTVAVVAGGIDVVYPPEHDILLARIAEEGVVVAELPPGYQPRAQDFPRRNRIIAGLALGVVVVEAAQRSGSLVTARYAEEFDRTVMAVPGHPRDPRAYGTNRLIRDGATLIATTEHVLQELAPLIDRAPVRPHQSTHATHGPTGFEEHPVRPPSLPRTSSPKTSSPKTSSPPTASPQTVSRETTVAATSHADAVLAAIGPAPTDIDDVIRATHLSVADVRVALLELSITGAIAYEAEGRVSRLE